MRRRLVRLLAGFALLLAVAIGGLLGFIYSGTYDVAATGQHSPPIYWALSTALRHSIRAHSAHEAPSPVALGAPRMIAQGLVLYDRNCAVCHGAPGIAPGAIGLGMNPPPPNLVLPARDGSARELYWTVSNGIIMTGMPAWKYRMSDQERWAVVAFLKAMPAMTPAQYRADRTRLVPADGERRSER